MSSPSKLASVADQLWSWNADELQSLQDVIAKMIDTKEAMLGAEAKIGVRQDRETADDLREIRHFLSDSQLDLNGPECVLLGSLHKHLEEAELLDTRGLNIWLDSYGRKPSNTTSTVENLEKKGFMEFVAGETLNSHKTFRLTDAGRSEIRNIMCRLARKSIVSMA